MWRYVFLPIIRRKVTKFLGRHQLLVVDFRSVVLCWGATHHLSKTSCSTQRSTWEVMIASDDWSSDSAQQVIVQLSVLWHEFFMLRTVLRGGSVQRLYISSLITHDVQTSPSRVKSPNYFLSLGTTCSILECGGSWCGSALFLFKFQQNQFTLAQELFSTQNVEGAQLRALPQDKSCEWNAHRGAPLRPPDDINNIKLQDLQDLRTREPAWALTDPRPWKPWAWEPKGLRTWEPEDIKTPGTRTGGRAENQQTWPPKHLDLRTQWKLFFPRENVVFFQCNALDVWVVRDNGAASNLFHSPVTRDRVHGRPKIEWMATTDTFTLT